MQPYWSRRAQNQIHEIRQEFPWITSDSTCIVQHGNGDIYWWNFAEGIANKMFADSVYVDLDATANDLSIRFRNATKVEPVTEQLDALSSDTVIAIPDIDAMENLKFFECLPQELSQKAFSARYNDKPAVRKILGQDRRAVVFKD